MVARLLQGQNGVASASDPIRPFFNYFRTFLQDRFKIHPVSDTSAPLKDYFESDFKYIAALKNVDLNHSIDRATLLSLRAEIKTQSKPYCPKFSDALKLPSESNLSATCSWKDEFLYYMNLIDSIYSDSSSKVIAFKEVWGIEMAIPLINTFGNKIKIIGVLRNPKSVFASSKKQAGNYPLFFVARQWRKQNVFFDYLKDNYPEQFFLLQYEEFCLEPERVYKKLMGQLLGNCEILLNSLPQAVDDSGEKWIKNSSFELNGNSEVDELSLYKWKSTLTDSEAEWIDYLTHMRADSSNNKSASIPLSKYPKRDQGSVASWMESLVHDLEHTNFEYNISIEEKRFIDSQSSQRGEFDSINNINKHL